MIVDVWAHAFQIVSLKTVFEQERVFSIRKQCRMVNYFFHRLIEEEDSVKGVSLSGSLILNNDLGTRSGMSKWRVCGFYANPPQNKNVKVV